MDSLTKGEEKLEGTGDGVSSPPMTRSLTDMPDEKAND